MGAIGAALPGMIERSKTSPNLKALANEAGEANNSENENENAPPKPAGKAPEVKNNENGNENGNNNGGIEFRHRTRKLLRLRK